MISEMISKSWRRVLTPCFLAGLAALLLLYHLGDRYLWQDEAQTAVLAERMLRFGRPLAYDGKNLVTIDYFPTEDRASIGQRAADPKAAIDYYIQRGDFKPDTTWIWHPWGQFIVEAISLKTLGRTTLAARLPFALAAIITVLLLYRFVLHEFNSSLIASLAALFLVFNTYWILHGRQCRYYSLSSLLLVVTLMSYARWQNGGRWGAFSFIAAAWCWFQVDYGTLWPVLVVLFADAFIAGRHRVWRPLMVGGCLAAALLPFVYYFELWRRHVAPARPWMDRFLRNLFNMNQYVVPMLIVIAAVVLLSRRWDSLPAPERRGAMIACATIAGFIVWVPLVAPTSFLRYVIIVAPLGSMLTAWVLVRGLGGARKWPVWIGAAVFLLTPWLTWLIPSPSWYGTSAVLRPELPILWHQVFARHPDPNGIVIEWLKHNASPSDEVLINYEDVPLMFYLPNPIRGGIAAFRVEDDARKPPEFIVLRRSVPWVHWPVYLDELGRYAWDEIPLNAPDVQWGNNPNPAALLSQSSPSALIYVARRIPSATAHSHTNPVPALANSGPAKH